MTLKIVSRVCGRGHSQIFEKYRCVELVTFFMDNKFSDRQFGFLKKKSTRHDLCRMSCRGVVVPWTTEKNLGFCGFSKAFDCVSHEILLKIAMFPQGRGGAWHGRPPRPTDDATRRDRDGASRRARAAPGTLAGALMGGAAQTLRFVLFQSYYAFPLLHSKTEASSNSKRLPIDEDEFHLNV